MNLKLKNISKTIKKKEILKDVNIEFKSNLIYGIVGENGTGKSVLLKIISGFYKPSSGFLYLNNNKLNLDDNFLPNSGIFIENPKFINDLTGYNNLKLLASINKKIKDEDIINYLKLFKLYDDKDVLYRNYSLGMKQKLGIIQAIMENPEIIILDEPFNALDIKVKNILIDYLNNIKENKIIIIVAHYREEIDNICDKIYLMDNKTLKELKSS